MSYDVAAVRKDFPILARQVHGKPLVFLDSAASAQKPRAVIDAMNDLYTAHYANVHRGVYQLSLEATDMVEAVRDKVAAFLGARDRREIVFTRNATEAINLIAYSYGRRHVHPGDEVLVTHMEHHGNFVPWQVLCEERGALLRVAPIDDRGVLLLDEFEKLLSPRTRIAAVTHVSNVLGTVNPVREIARLCRARGVPLAGRRRAGGPAPARRRECNRLRLLRVLGAQAVRPIRRRRAVGPRRAARGDAAVPDRRLDDRIGDAAGHDVRGDSAALRGGHARHRRDRGTRCGDRLCRADRLRRDRCARARAAQPTPKRASPRCLVCAFWERRRTRPR